MDLVEIRKGLPSALRPGAQRMMFGPGMTPSQKAFINNRQNANVLGRRAGANIANARTLESTAKRLKPVKTPYGGKYDVTDPASWARAGASREREMAGESIKLGRRNRDVSRTQL